MDQINQSEIVGGPEKQSKGPTISAVIIVIILILGGAYLLLSKPEVPAGDNMEGAGIQDGTGTGENSLTTSPDPTDVSDLELDLEIESPDFLNEDVNSLEIELQ